MSSLRHVGRADEPDHLLDRVAFSENLNIPLTKDGIESAVRATVQSNFLVREDFEAKKLPVVSESFLISERAKYIPKTERGIPNGYATLDGAGKILPGDTYLTDTSRPWVKIGSYTSQAGVSGVSTDTPIAPAYFISPGFSYIPVIFGLFVVDGFGAIEVRHSSTNRVLARGVRARLPSGAHAVQLVPTDPFPMTGALSVQIWAIPTTGETSSFQGPMTVTAGGQVFVFGIPV
jgi:hypothetical protein